MGTVGLSFGSPTSGTGIDVSSTVATMVSNLQQIETPWKNQLTALESQDTVISNLGSLFSTVSTDIGQLTDFEGVLAQKSGSSSDTSVLELTSASSSAVAGTHTVVVNNLAQTSSGYLAPITNGNDTLSGSITLQVGSGTAQTINISSLSNQTLAGLAAAINQSGVGIDASVLTDSSGSRLSLVSATSGANGNISVTANSIADASTTSGTLAYTAAVTGADASLTVDGVNLTSASNTVTNLIPGITFQLLSASPQQAGSNGTSTAEPVQVVIANDNSGVESAVNQLVTDYNSLMTAINAQEGNDSSGNAEPLFGSPTLSLLQQQLLSSLNAQNPSGYLDAVQSVGTTLSGSISITVAGGQMQTIDVPDSPNDTIQDLANAINAADIGVTAGVNTQNGESSLTLTSQTVGSSGALTVSPNITATSDTILNYSSSQFSSGTLDPVASAGDSLSGTLSIQVGSGTAQSFDLSSLSDPTLSGLADAINAAGMGVTASVVTNSDGTSSLSLMSQTAGSGGALSVNSSVADTSQGSGADLSFTGTSTAGGTFNSITTGGANLSGSITIAGSNGTQKTINMSDLASSDQTLAGLAAAINADDLGVTALVSTNSNGSSLILQAQTAGSSGSFSVTSNLLDTTDVDTTTPVYTNSSDVGSLTQLGISLNNDGTMTFDASTLDSLLNSDFNGVLGFFQNENSWGQSFATMLNNAGSSSPSGVLALAAQSNSSIESELNTKITNENNEISTQQTQLTNELNQANEVLQELPSQLNGMNELYSAITGYNEQDE
jgi:flagellar hook-associated protein 2